jgi:peptidoglycan/xylan/chitin deacetylase (PgdA/CDA1 family)
MRNRRAIVSFTFDDFPSSAVSNGARLLEDHGARGTFYLTGSYCGRGRRMKLKPHEDMKIGKRKATGRRQPADPRATESSRG